MFKRQRKLSLEQMEVRMMMAGDVAAAVTGGTLYLTEAAGQAGLDNSVVISQIAPGRVRVQGNPTSTDGAVGKVNGAAFQDFTVANDLVVKFGGGSDNVVFDQSAPPSFRNVNIDLAAPPVLAAQAVVANATGAVTSPIGRPDNNNVILWNESIRGSLTINTGAGSDYVYIANGAVGGPTTISTGAGADIVDIENLQGTVNGAIDIQTFTSLSETDSDTVWLDHVSASGNINVRTGGGDDFVHLGTTTAYQDVNLDTGAGNDTVKLTDVCAVNNFFANLGDGNDLLTTTDLYVIHGKTQIDGGAGTDSITKSGAYPTTQLTQSNFEFVNGQPVITLPISPIGAPAKA